MRTLVLTGTLLLSFLVNSTGLAATSADYYKAGLSLYNQGNYTGSIPYLKAAVQLDPQNWQAHQVLGYAYFRTQDRGRALAEFDESLRIHPDNPSLKDFADRMRPSPSALPPVTEPTAPSPSSEVETWKSPVNATNQPEGTKKPDPFPKKNWMEVRAGAAYATLGDLGGPAVDGFKAAWSGFPGSSTSASSSGIGLAAGADGFLALDKENAIGLEGTVGFFGGLTQAVTWGSAISQETYQPMMGAIEVKYLHSFPMGDSRLRAEVGGGLYTTTVHVDSVFDSPGGGGSVVGPMSGLGFGASAGLSWEFPMGSSFSLGGYLKGRFATTSGIQGTFEDEFGNQIDLGLAKYQGQVGWAQTSSIGSGGIEWANVDYSGAEGGLFLAFIY